MAQQSKYSDQQINQILTDMLAVLEKHQAPVELSLVVLGNMTSNLLIHHLGEQQRLKLAQAFANALFDSLKKHK